MTKWLFASAYLLLIFYAVLSHPFEIPDEQSHYATTHFLVTMGIMPTRDTPKNLSLEEEDAEKLLGIMTDGSNRYSYHPEYKPAFAAGLTSPLEQSIISLNTTTNRRTFTIHQSALYPPLYYYLASFWYRLVDSADILTRLYSMRLGMIFLAAAIVPLSYQLGLMFFEQKFLSLVLSAMTLYFPMLGYLGSGINSDNLHNLLFSLIILMGLKLIKNGWHVRDTVIWGIFVGLDFLTKPQAYIAVLVVLTAALMRGKSSSLLQTIKHLFIMALLTVAIAGCWEIPRLLGANPYLAENSSFNGQTQFHLFLSNYLSSHRAIIVWYWGVYKWLGVVLPHWVWWVANRLWILAGLGIVRKFWMDYRAHQLSSTSRYIIYFVVINIIYAASLFWYDWQFWQQYGRSLGMQARYYYPLLITQLALLLAGINHLFTNPIVRLRLIYLLIIFFVALQLFGVYTLASGYYDLSSLGSFITQASQYKPFFIKGDWWYLWIACAIMGSTIPLHLIIRSKKST